MPKKVAGNVSGTMELHDKVKRLEAELDNAQLQAGQLQRENNQLRLQTAPGLLKDAEHALVWALAHPDFQPGGKYHEGARGTAVPVLRALQTANGTAPSPAPASSAEQPAQVPPAEKPAEQTEPQGDAGEQPAG